MPTPTRPRPRRGRVAATARRPVTMSVEPQADPSQRSLVSDRLDLFNVARTGLDRWHSVAIFLRDGDDEVVGGLLGAIWGGWLHVTYLWIAEPFRGAGHARALLRRAERFALERGCHAVRIESHSFQAPGFYRKEGYEEWGVLDDYPPGHRLHFLKKTLAPRAGRAHTATPRRHP